MVQWLRFFLQAILVIAIALLAVHGQQIWYNHEQGWLQAWRIEYAKAGDVMIGALVAVIVVGLLEYFYWRKRDKEARENTKILRAIVEKLGIDETEYKDVKPKRKHKS